MQVLYFGWVRSRIGIGKEELSPPQEVANVFEDSSALRVAVNQEIAPLDTAITDADEVALFPPMTGG